MAAKDLYQWLLLGALVLAAGMWLGRLDNRVTQIEKIDQYLHGTITVPGGSSK